MTNCSESLYVNPRSNLETFIDILYVLAEESKPLKPINLREKTNTNDVKLKKLLELGEKKGLISSYELEVVCVYKTGKRKKYELTSRGKELIYTWLDYVDRFSLKVLLKNRNLDSLPEKENSRLEEIMKKPWKEPNYRKSEKRRGKRSPIILYRDFLNHIKSYYPDNTYQADIIKSVNINSEKFENFRKIAIERKHIERINLEGTTKWRNFLVKKESARKKKILPIKIPLNLHWNIDELIHLTENGYRCVNTFDKIMMEYELTDLVYSYKNHRINAH